jgi:hypothetical protein
MTSDESSAADQREEIAMNHPPLQHGGIEGWDAPLVLGPLKCPACGGRGFDDGGSFWLEDAQVRLDAQGVSTIVVQMGFADVWIDCARCDHVGMLTEFQPPWADPTRRCRVGLVDQAPVPLPGGTAPLGVSDADRLDEAACNARRPATDGGA